MAPKLQRKRWRRPQRLTLEGPPVARRKDLVMPTVLDLEPGEALARNRRRTSVVLGVFAVLVVLESAVVWLLGLGWIGALAVIACGGGYLAIGARKGDGWVRYALRATPVTAPEIVNALDSVALQAKAPRPELLMVPGEAPNALALGLKVRLVCVTSGTTRLTRLGREALLAHELAHLRDGDALLASAYILLGGAMELVSKAVRGPAGIALLLSVPVWPACLVVRLLGPLLLSDDREHRADVVGSLVTRYPPAMAEVLREVSVEHATSALRSTDRFWFAPRAQARGPDPVERAKLVSEM